VPRLQGGGVWSVRQGRVRGRRVILAGLLLGVAGPRAPAGDWLLPPIAGELAGEFQARAVPGAPSLHWTLALRNAALASHTGQLAVTGPGTTAHAEFALDAAGNGTWRLVDGQVSLQPWLNGQFSAGEVTVSGVGTLQGGTFVGTLNVELRDVDLGELAALADATHQYVRTAKGRVEGRVVIRLAADAPPAFDGGVRLVKGSVGVVTLQPSPGLLTNYVPAQVRKLYPGIEAIELGQTALEAGVLRLTFHPAGDAAGRTAVLRIEGHPLDPKIIAPLELDVNISGPVENLLRQAFSSRLRMGN
jgi:hypothetical protein